MTTKPLPPHGTYARANGSPGRRAACRCAPCHNEWLRTRKRYHVNRQLGRPAEVDATPARQHLELLRRTMTWAQIADASQVECRTLQLLGAGRQQVLRRGTLARIKAVPPVPPSAPGHYLDSTGCRRRLQALRVLGYSAKVLAEIIGTAETRIHLICSGSQPRVRFLLASRIFEAYATLTVAPAPDGRSATMARRCAKANGWLGPAWWDASEIDDPAFVPAIEDTPSLKRLEVEHLLRCGLRNDEVQARTDASIAYVREIAAELRTGKPRDRSRQTDMGKAA